MEPLLSYPIRRLFTDARNRFVPRDGHTIINWGNSRQCVWQVQPAKVVNDFARVALASNKLSCFNQLKDKPDVCIPEFTTSRDVAASWIRDGIVAVARTVLNGHSGAGIVLCDSADSLVDAPLYVQYVKKVKEFRVHVAFGSVIDVQEKRQRKTDNDIKPDFKVRNASTGWVYCREDITEPAGLRELGLAVVRELGLDFGAVDIIWNQKHNKCVCLEVNTAPGLEGSTVTAYANAFTKAFKKCTT